jgi:hypothetical protein
MKEKMLMPRFGMLSLPQAVFKASAIHSKSSIISEVVIECAA